MPSHRTQWHPLEITISRISAGSSNFWHPENQNAYRDIIPQYGAMVMTFAWFFRRILDYKWSSCTMVAYELLRYVQAWTQLQVGHNPWELILSDDRLREIFPHIKSNKTLEAVRDPFGLSLDMLATLEGHIYLSSLNLLADAILPPNPIILEAGAHIGEDAIGWRNLFKIVISRAVKASARQKTCLTTCRLIIF